MVQESATEQSMRIDELAEIPEQLRTLLAPSETMRKRYGERSQKGPSLGAMMAHNPPIAQMFIPLSIHLAMSGMLPGRDREIAVMRLAWLAKLPFVWGEHVRMGKLEGITSEEVERVTQGSSAEGWSEHDRAILRAVEGLHQKSEISDDTWNVLARTWNKGQLVELPMLVGSYIMLGWFQAAVRFPMWEGNQGMAAR